MIRVILWDVDGTLLNFPAAERQSLMDSFEKFGLGPCPEDRVARYSKLNASYWKRLEKGEITKAELLPGRFREFFQQEGIHSGHGDGFATHLAGNILLGPVNQDLCDASVFRLPAA